MANGKRSLVAASRKHMPCSRFLGRRLVQSSFGEIAGESWIGCPSLLISGLDSGSANEVRRI